MDQSTSDSGPDHITKKRKTSDTRECKANMPTCNNSTTNATTASNTNADGPTSAFDISDSHDDDEAFAISMPYSEFVGLSGLNDAMNSQSTTLGNKSATSFAYTTPGSHNFLSAASNAVTVNSGHHTSPLGPYFGFYGSEFPTEVNREPDDGSDGYPGKGWSFRRGSDEAPRASSSRTTPAEALHTSTATTRASNRLNAPEPPEAFTALLPTSAPAWALPAPTVVTQAHNSLPGPVAPTDSRGPNGLTTIQMARQSYAGKYEINVTTMVSGLLAEQPAMRSPEQRYPDKRLNYSSKRPENVEALFGQICGTEADNGKECRSCLKGNGPFKSCVFFEGYMFSACANCRFNSCQKRCDYHQDKTNKPQEIFQPLSQQTVRVPQDPQQRLGSPQHQVQQQKRARPDVLQQRQQYRQQEQEQSRQATQVSTPAAAVLGAPMPGPYSMPPSHATHGRTFSNSQDVVERTIQRMAQKPLQQSQAQRGVLPQHLPSQYRQQQQQHDHLQPPQEAAPSPASAAAQVRPPVSSVPRQFPHLAVNSALSNAMNDQHQQREKQRHVLPQNGDVFSGPRQGIQTQQSGTSSQYMVRSNPFSSQRSATIQPSSGLPPSTAAGSTPVLQHAVPAPAPDRDPYAIPTASHPIGFPFVAAFPFIQAMIAPLAAKVRENNGDANLVHQMNAAADVLAYELMKFEHQYGISAVATAVDGGNLARVDTTRPLDEEQSKGEQSKEND